jgi:26S proteasome regulatory subunit T4
MDTGGEPDPREKALQEYRRKLVQHRELDTKVRSLREDVKKARSEFDKTEDDLKALQSVGQIIGEVLRQLDEERCELAARRLPSRLRPGCRSQRV